MVAVHSVRPSVSFFLGTTCGVLLALIVLNRLRHRTSWEVGEGERDEDDRDVAPFLFPGKTSLPSDKKTRDDTEVVDDDDDDYDDGGGDAEPEGMGRRRSSSSRRKQKKRKKRKVFLDCGANTATSVDLFLDTYPDGELLVAARP